MNMNNTNNFYQMMNNQMMNNQMMNNQMMNNQVMNNQMMYNQMMNNQMMNNQMNQNIQNNNNENEEEKHMLIFLDTAYDGIFNTLTDQKKLIIFKDPLKNEMITKKIPISFTKNDLYSFVNGINAEKTILLYENNILNDDNSSINDIQDNATIFLFSSPSFINFRQSSLYKYLCNIYPNSQKINVFAYFNGKKYNFVFLSDFSISLIIKLFHILLDIKKDACYLYGESKLDINDNTKIGNLFSLGIVTLNIVEQTNLSAKYFEGKKIKVIMFYKNQNKFKFFDVTKYSCISHLFGLSDDLNNKKILYNGNELNKNDKASLASLGINDDFGCIVEEI